MLASLACEVEAILNHRPLTTVSNDVSDLELLTPNHLLLLKTPKSLPPGMFQNGDLHSRKFWRQVLYLANLFWSRWVKEYPLNLQVRQKWARPKPNLIPGDIVLVCDSSLPQSSWPMGKSYLFLQTWRAMFAQHELRLRTLYWFVLSLNLCYYFTRSRILVDTSCDTCVVYIIVML